MDGDESFAAWVADHPASFIVTLTSDAEPHPPLYYLALRGWMLLAGDRELPLRWLSLAGGTLAVAATVRLGWLLGGWRLGALAGALAAINPFLVLFSQVVRMYGLAAAGGGLSLAAFALWLRRPSRARLAAYVAATLLACATHYYALFLVAAQDLIVLVQRRRSKLERRTPTCSGSTVERRLRAWWWGQLVLLALYLPVLVPAGQLLYRYQTARIPLASELAALPTTWARFGTAWFVEGSAVEALGLVAATLALLGLARFPWRRGRRWLAPACFLLPFAGGLATSLLRVALAAGHGTPAAAPYTRPLLEERFLIVSITAYCVLLAAGGLALPRSAPGGEGDGPHPVPLSATPSFKRAQRLPVLALFGTAGLLAVVGGNLVALGNAYFAPRYANRTGYGSMVAYVRERQGPDDAVVLDGRSQWFQYWYYSRRPPALALPTLTLPAHVPSTADDLAADLERALRGRSGAWLSVVAADAFDPHHDVEHWLASHAFRALEVPFHNYRLVYYTLGEANTPLPAPAATFGGVVRLEGAAVTTSTVRAGGALALRLAWSAERQPRRDVVASLRLLDATGRRVALADAPLGGGFQPATAWAPGARVEDRRGLVVPPDVAPGAYRLELVVYDPQGGPLSPAAPAGAQRASTPEAVALGEVRVEGRRVPPLVEPRTEHRLARDLGALRLLGYDGPAPSLEAGQTVRLALLWQGLGRPAAPLTLQLRGRQNSPVAATPVGQLTLSKGEPRRETAALRVPPGAEAGRYEVWLQGPVGLSLGWVDVTSRPRTTSLPPGVPLAWLPLGEGVSLIGHQTEPSVARAGAPLQVTLYWQTAQPLSADYSVFVHLLDRTHKVVAQHDGQPGGGSLPCTTWQPGEVVADRHDLAVPTGLPSGTYQLEVGLYDAASGRRVANAAEDHLTLPVLVG